MYMNDPSNLPHNEFFLDSESVPKLALDASEDEGASLNARTGRSPCATIRFEPSVVRKSDSSVIK